uniref:Outer membrane channel protein CpnT-like N-terminal domain-containing protein n=1 Tax=Streptomyces sp. NBC_00003 TaxID=2903608 RepID=A0AAU2V6D9_9ACTN
MSASDKVREIVTDVTGIEWPAGDVGKLRDIANAWRQFADDMEGVAAAANKAAQALIHNNKGEAISAFADPFWARYYHDKKGWLQDLVDGPRDLATGFDNYADAVADAKKKLDHELEIVGATIAVGTGLAIFTLGISEAAAAAATTAIVELATTVGVTLTTEVATIAGTAFATAAIAGIESVTVDLAVAQPLKIAAGIQTDGLNLAEARDAGIYGTLTGGAFGGTGKAFQLAQESGGLTGLFPGLANGLGGPRTALAGVADGLPANDPYLFRTGSPSGAAGEAGPGKGPWPAPDVLRGPAAGKELKLPNARHTVSGSASGEVKESNSVILRGHEREVAQDIADIASGKATYVQASDRYEVNGRTYGVENSGRVYPDGGPGIAKLDRNEYAALQQVAKAKGDLSAAPQLTRAPRFTNNPGIVEKALAIYNGTYP